MFFWIIYTGILIYMEAVFHLNFFGAPTGNLLFPLGLIALVSSVQTLVTGLQARKKMNTVFWLLVLPEYLIFAAQAVYLKIFKQPLRIGMAVIGGRDALTNFWREALRGIADTLPLLFWLALPLFAAAVLQKRDKWPRHPLRRTQQLGLISGVCGSLVYCVLCMTFGNALKTNYAESYLDFYDPYTVLRNMGVLTMVQRDGWRELEGLLADSGRKVSPTSGGIAMTRHAQTTGAEIGDALVAWLSRQEPQTPEPDDPPNPELPLQETDDSKNGGEDSPVIDTSPNALEIDFELLKALSENNRDTKWLTEYIAGLTPTSRNQYTGIFKGFNLIYLTAESFSPYVVREDLTPTLYKMANSSFVFTNYYVPLWQTSTSDGEYVNCTGLIPDDQHSMRRSASINMAFTLPRFFAKEGGYSWAYHNNEMDYYGRHISHPNLGYDYRGSELGNLSPEEWGDKIFPMKEPSIWPASDYEMMCGTMPDYIDSERFHAYYMTVSGHLNYEFSANKMAARNRDAVAGLDMSENALAYLACNIELDKALAYIVEQLEAAGKLDTTVICLSADHYPYAMTEEQYEEVAGKDLSRDMDLYRNTLILWNAAMKEPVIVDKACCSVDILPTLLNLFGFEFDSRMFAGRDILSEEEGLVIFSDRSFVSDTVIYNRQQKTATWLADLSQEEQEAYLKDKEQDVRDRYQFSAYVLRNDYYDLVTRALRRKIVFD